MQSEVYLVRAAKHRNIRDWLHRAEADVVLEGTSLNLDIGMPATH
jgi:hypothetical protein